ncbi:hypothetical protein DOE78_13050 [Bacillus sp. Y1]|nr:hypothetical protein [Bacillus sp. Y1]AYA76297.1 hypothetical protein DOE78_13050 [Bacillus sp. Y1]
MKKTLHVFLVVLLAFMVNSQGIYAKEMKSIQLLGVGAVVQESQNGEFLVKTEGLKAGEGFVSTPKDFESKNILFQMEAKGSDPVILKIEETDARGKFLKEKELEVPLTRNWSPKQLDFMLESVSSQIDVFVLTKEKKKTEFSVRNVTVTGQ